MDEQIIEQKIEEQNVVLKTLYQQSEKTNRYLIWLKVLSILKLLIILIPIVFGIIYLPPFVEKTIEKYKEVLPGLQKAEQFINQETKEAGNCCPCPEPE